MKAIFVRLLDVPTIQKGKALACAIRDAADEREGEFTSSVFLCDPSVFVSISGSPFAYWVNSAVREVFSRIPPLENEGRIARITNQLSDNFRFARLWFEVCVSGTRWFPWAKGGAYSPYFSDIHTVVGWDERRGTYFGGFVGTSHRPLAKPASADLFFRGGLTWPCRTQGGFGMRALPAGCVFGQKGPGCFVDGDSPPELLALLGITMGVVFRYLVQLQTSFGAYEVGIIQKTPVPSLPQDIASELGVLTRRAWSLRRLHSVMIETSRAFALPFVLAERAANINLTAIARELDAIQARIDDISFQSYEIGSRDQSIVESLFPRTAAGERAPIDSEHEGDDADEYEFFDSASAHSLISWLVGVAFARFDPRLATGERPIPPEPEPFDPLPSRSPGMYPEGEEPADRPSLLVDDEGHPDDLVARVRAIAERVKVDLPENLRHWLARDFFELHIKMYSKSRRKAPIYWQLATPSASYSVWLYLHAFNKDTLFRVQNDYVVPKLAHEERRLDALTLELRDGATAAQRKQLAAQQGFVEELRAFLDEVKRVAPLWGPDLDDGVVINFAPLWRLVPQHKAWQKELRATWDALCGAEYDWSHLAMRLWPERVVPKCAKDRSLAIAHGLEDVFWVEGADGKWTARKKPTKDVDALVQERTSAAVKSALQRLLDAPTAQGVGRKPRKGKA